MNSKTIIVAALLVLSDATLCCALQPKSFEINASTRQQIGTPAGLIPVCPGVTKNVSISRNMKQHFLLVLQRVTPSGKVIRHSKPIGKMSTIVSEKKVDLINRKTVVYAVGFLDSSLWPHNQAIGNAYSKRGYNVFISETFTFLTYIYPKSVRLTIALGKMVGEFLVKLYEKGLQPENLELLGTSLGAHVVSFAAKHFYSVTGKKPSRLTGLDPAGPCFRSLGPKYRLDKSDAEFVDVIHTNIDGFGIADTLGHVDFYANGGEYQPSDITYLPCLVVCSHVRAFVYWWIALENPKKFIAMKCDSVQDARYSNCYNSSVTNYFGLETDFKKQGIFYLSTHNEFPYYRGKAGLNPDNDVYKNLILEINAEDDLVI